MFMAVVWELCVAAWLVGIFRGGSVWVGVPLVSLGLNRLRFLLCIKEISKEKNRCA